MALTSLTPMHLLVTPIAYTIAAPFDYIRFKLQLEGGDIRGFPPSWNLLSNVWSQGNLSKLWAGNYWNCLRPIPAVLIDMYVGMGVKQLFGKLFGVQAERDAWLLFLSGAMRGIIDEAVIYPFEVAHMRYLKLCYEEDKEDDSKVNRQERSSATSTLQDLFYELWHDRFGLSEFYSTIIYKVVHVATSVMFASIFLDNMGNRSYRAYGREPHWAWGYGADLAACVVSYPFDTIRRRMMAEKECNSSWPDKAKEIWNEGPDKYGGWLKCFSFFKGFSTKIIKGVVVVAVLAFADNLEEYRIYTTRRKNTIIVYKK